MLDGVKVAVIAPTLQSEWLTGMLESFCERMKAHGCETQLESADNDNSRYITLIENFVTMGCECVLVVAQDAESIQDACEKAMDAGTYIMMLGLYPDNYEISGGVASDFYLTGWAVSDMAMYWVDTAMADVEDVPVALHTSDGFSDGLKRGQGMKDRIADHDRAYVDYIKDMGDGNVEKGFTMAEEALTYNNNIRVFVTYDPDPAVGANNYIEMQPELNLEDFGAFCVGSSEAATELCDKSVDNESCLRGILTYGGDDPGETLHDIAYALLTGEHEPPYWIFDPCYTYTHLDYEFVEEGVSDRY